MSEIRNETQEKQYVQEEITIQTDTEEQQTKDDFIMLPTVDTCFVGLMENDQVRRSVCAAALGVPPETIGETVMLNRNLEREHADDKLGILDARVLFTNGDQMNLEMQVISYAHWNNRSLFYLCKMLADQLKKGEDYGKLKKCVQVSILDFNWFADDGYFWRRVRPIDEITGECYNENFELQIWELPKLEDAMKQYNTDSVDVLLQKMKVFDSKIAEKYTKHADIFRWMQFFNGENKEDFRMLAQSNEDMKSAYETLEKMSADLQKRFEYEAREKAIRDQISLLKDVQRAKESIEAAEQQREAAEQQREAAEQQREAAENRAEAVEQQREAAENRAEAAESRAATAEAEVARLRAELAALRK